MLSKPWSELLAECRAERGALLGTNDYDELAGIEKAERLDIIDSRLKLAEEWMIHYETERTAAGTTSIFKGFRMRKWLREATTLSDEELEGVS